MKRARKNNIFLLFLFLGVIVFGSDVYGSEFEPVIRRLSPSEFSMLPQNVINYLKSHGCTIPQAHDKSQPHNVIRGEFFKKGQKDWAVLCSKKQITSILIFKGGSTNEVVEIAPSSEDVWLQIFADGVCGFSREIIVADENTIRHYVKIGKESGQQIELMPIIHDGIEDLFVNKASVVYYYYRGQWIRILGSD